MHLLRSGHLRASVACPSSKGGVTGGGDVKRRPPGMCRWVHSAAPQPPQRHWAEPGLTASSCRQRQSPRPPAALRAGRMSGEARGGGFLLPPTSASHTPAKGKDAHVRQPGSSFPLSTLGLARRTSPPRAR